MVRPATLVALLAALAPGAALPPQARAGTGAARLVVSVAVVRSVAVSVGAGADGTAVLVRTPGGELWVATLAEAARTPGVAVGPYAPDPRYLVVTVHADAPLAPR